jgi:acyl-CoA synthetase (AMP-forming)/AMP-acid ligase II
VPLFGVFGFMAALAALAGGAACVLVAVFDAEKAAQLIRDARVSHAVGSDAMFAPILALGAMGRTPADATPHWPAWRHIVQADFVGLALTVTEQATLQGIRASGTYGSSEVFSLMALQDWSADNAQRALGGGTVVDSAIQLRVVHPETGAQLGDGEPGELQIKGPNVMARYLNNPEATTKATTADAWYRSGDLATARGERFTYLARMGDSLRLRGFLVNPAEIEACLMQYQGVTGAQVVGVQRPGLGDQAVAYVVLTSVNAAQGIEDRLIAHCRAQMASYKVPVYVKVLTEFPTLSGPNGVKIQKRVLREQARTDILTSLEHRA